MKGVKVEESYWYLQKMAWDVYIVLSSDREWSWHTEEMESQPVAGTGKILDLTVCKGVMAQFSKFNNKEN